METIKAQACAQAPDATQSVEAEDQGDIKTAYDFCAAWIPPMPSLTPCPIVERPSHLAPEIRWQGDDVSAEKNHLHDYSEFGEHQQMIGETILIFLLTHAPDVSTDCEADGELRGILTDVEAVESRYRKDDAKAPALMSVISDLLGFASVSIMHEIQHILSSKVLRWEDVYWRHLRAKDTISHTAAKHEGKTLSSYHWAVLKEMLRYSRCIELSDATARLKPTECKYVTGPLNYTQLEICLCCMRKHNHLAWYNLPVGRKVVRMQEVLDFLCVRLPRELEDVQEGWQANNKMRERAELSGPEVKKKFLEMRCLVKCIRDELIRWEVQDEKNERVRAGDEDTDVRRPSIISSGFPNSRQFKELGTKKSCRFDYGKYPRELVEAEKRRRAKTPGKWADLKYQRPTLIGDVCDEETKTRYNKFMEEMDDIVKVRKCDGIIKALEGTKREVESDTESDSSICVSLLSMENERNGRKR